MSTATDGHRSSRVPQPDDEARISEAVRDIAEQRAFIEQAKGMLMFIYGLNADAAFRTPQMALTREQHQGQNDCRTDYIAVRRARPNPPAPK